MSKHRIKFTDEDGGWYAPRPGINQFIYGRVFSKKNAFKFYEDEAIEIIQEANDKGYDCHAVPPIIIKY